MDMPVSYLDSDSTILSNFLALPAEALTRADCDDPEINAGALWDILRRLHRTGMREVGSVAVLRADRDGWRMGREIYI